MCLKHAFNNVLLGINCPRLVTEEEFVVAMQHVSARANSLSNVNFVYGGQPGNWDITVLAEFRAQFTPCLRLEHSASTEFSVVDEIIGFIDRPLTQAHFRAVWRSASSPGSWERVDSLSHNVWPMSDDAVYDPEPGKYAIVHTVHVGCTILVDPFAALMHTLTTPVRRSQRLRVKASE